MPHGSDAERVRRPRTPPRSWTGVPIPLSYKVRDLLVRAGAVEDRELSGTGELWRARLGTSIFTGYRTGTIYSTGGGEPELGFLYDRISGMIGHQ